MGKSAASRISISQHSPEHTTQHLFTFSALTLTIQHYKSRDTVSLWGPGAAAARKRGGAREILLRTTNAEHWRARELPGHSRVKTPSTSLPGTAEQRDAARRDGPVPLAYPYYLRWPTAVPLLSATGVFGGRPGRVPRPRVARRCRQILKDSGRLVRRLLVARLTVGTPSSGRCSLNCHPRDYTVAYLVGRVSTSVMMDFGQNLRSRHCPHARLPRRRANIAAS